MGQHLDIGTVSLHILGVPGACADPTWRARLEQPELAAPRGCAAACVLPLMSTAERLLPTALQSVEAPDPLPWS